VDRGAEAGACSPALALRFVALSASIRCAFEVKAATGYPAGHRFDAHFGGRLSAGSLHWSRAAMEILTRVSAGSHDIECGIATTAHEHAAVLAQRFRVYQRRGYHRPGLQHDRDAYDRRAVSFVALLCAGDEPGFLLGSARLVCGDNEAAFRFPIEDIFELKLPAAVQEVPVPQRAEVSRLVVDSVQGIVVGGLLTPLSLIQAITVYSQAHDIRLGFSIMKSRFLRALHIAGLPFHELAWSQLTYPHNGAMAGYFYRDPDPVVPVYWLAEEIAPAVARAIARHQGARE
jgi:hypothetical protein